MPENPNALKEFADAELAKLDKRRDDAIKGALQSWREDQDDSFLRHWHRGGTEVAPVRARGGLPFMPKLDVGENLRVLEPELPKDTKDQNENPRKQFVARIPGSNERYAWNVNPESPLYRDLLVNLTAAPCLLKIVRVGTQKNDTRYTVQFQKKVEPLPPATTPAA